MTLNNDLLYETDNINGTNGVASYCTFYQFQELFLAGKLVNQSPRKV